MRTEKDASATPPTMGMSVASSGSDGVEPRNAHDRMTLKNGSIACAGRVSQSNTVRACVELPLPRARLDGVRERHADCAQAHVRQQVAQCVHGSQRQHANDDVLVNLRRADGADVRRRAVGAEALYPELRGLGNSRCGAPGTRTRAPRGVQPRTRALRCTRLGRLLEAEQPHG